MGEMELSRQASEEAIQISRRIEYAYGLGTGLMMSSSLAIMTENFALAEDLLDEIMPIAQSIGNPGMTGMAEINRAELAAKTGQYHQGRLAYERAAACFREIGDRIMELVIRSDVGHMLRRQGDIEAALAVYKYTILDWFDRGHRPAVAHQLESIAMVAVAKTEYLRAARLLGAAGGLREAAEAEIVDPQELREFEDTRSVLLAKMGMQDYQEGYSAGQLLPVEKVIEYAVSDDEEWFIIS
jgi:tetratricopeptide (TPR) repeat protein